VIAVPSPHLRAKSPFPRLWIGLIGMAILTIAALGLSIGQWQRPLPGMLVDPFGIVDDFGWPAWNGYQQGLSYPDRVVAADGHLITPRAGAGLDALAARSAETPERTMKLLVDPGNEPRVVVVRVERLGFAPWLLLSGGYILFAWVWLCAAGLLYTVRPQSRAVGAFVRLVIICATLMLTVFDAHTTRQLLLFIALAAACLPSALIEFGLCFPERLPTIQAHPRLLQLLRLIDVALFVVLIVGYFSGRNIRIVTDMSSAAAMVLLTVTLSLRCATAHGRRRMQLLIALLLIMPIYIVLGVLLSWGPERAAPYLYVAVVPLTVFGALGIAYALLRYDLWDSRTLLRRPGVRPLFTTALSFAVSLLCALGFVAIRRNTDALLIVYVLLAVALAGPLVRRAAEWLDAKLFPTDVHYRDTVEQLSLRFTDLGSQTAVVEAVEKAVRQVVDCARVRLLPLHGPLWTPGSDSAGLGRFLPKVAQAMAAAAAIANEKSGPGDSDDKQPASAPATDAAGSSSGTLAPTPAEWRNLRTLRRIVKTASLFALTPEQEAALARGELVYLTPKVPMVSSVPALWSWLLIAVRFRDRIVGVLAVAPKSVAQIFTTTSESLLRTIANQAALALYCASVSEQLESLRRTQEGQAREQLEVATAALSTEIVEALAGGAVDAQLLETLRAIAVTRTLKKQPQPLRPLVERARQLLRDRLQSRLLEVDLPPLIEVDCDGEALTQILSDLMSNALDGCPAPGRVGLSVSVEADQRLRLTVWDSAAGPLFKGDRLLPQVAQPATRLPLFRQIIAQWLARAHGWECVPCRRGDRNSIELLLPVSEWRRRKPGEGGDDDEDASGT
jgi:hypothetical protein